MDEKIPPTIEEQLAALTAALEAQKEIAAGQAKTIATLQGAIVAEKAEPKKKPVLPKSKLTITGKEYKFRLAQFNFESKTILAEDAALDKDLLKRIVAVPGQNVLKEQV